MALTSKTVKGASTYTPLHWKYDVLVSFSGEDTRTNFTDHLHTALNQRGFVTFKDERGQPIPTQLLEATKGSRICIVVFSKNYATSSGCLDQLQQIVQCRNDFGQIVLPVFYYVDPSEVCASFDKAFPDHEKENLEKLAKWRTSLAEVVSLSGWNLRNSHESLVIQEICEEILRKLGNSLSNNINDLVGVEGRVEEMLTVLQMGLNDVRVTGIYGMGGIGKTTLARVIYDMYSSHFEGCSFLENIREVSSTSGHGLAGLQQRLISQVLIEKDASITRFGISRLLKYKRVLIVLDDVSELKQLEALAGKTDWFGPGSRIIITTRDKHLLTAHGMVKGMIYKAKQLLSDEALQLLSWRAFNENQPPENYKKLSHQIVSYSSGLPLAIKVLGSFLCDRSIAEWESTLKRLKENPEGEIFNVLKISYDGLRDTEKKMFLDIACFFKREYVEPVSKILESCGCFPDVEMGVLVEKCLITIDVNKMIGMHDLLEETGLTIVRQESLKEPGQRSRLWAHDDISHVLTEKTGSEKVESIYLKQPKSVEIRIDADAFSKMKKLRLLKIQGMQPTKGLAYLSNELRILEWDGYPLKSLPSSFNLEKLVRLSMPHSRIEQLWMGSLKLEMLTVIEISHSTYLTKIPDLVGVVNLEKLILEGCVNLRELHPSVGQLKKLIVLNLKFCRNLRSLPDGITGLKSLKGLDLCGCTKLENLPDNMGELESLEVLDLGNTVVRNLSSSILVMKNLKSLSIRGWKEPCKLWDILLRGICFLEIRRDPAGLVLPSSFSGWPSLTNLNLSACNLSEGSIPADIGHLSGLEELNLSHNNFVTLPDSISQLSWLRKFALENCPKLRSVPVLPRSIEDLKTYNCPSLQTLTPPADVLHTRCFLLGNCFRLADNVEDHRNLALELMKRHLDSLAGFRVQLGLSIIHKLADEAQGIRKFLFLTIFSLISVRGVHDRPTQIPKLRIHLPGSEIPDWFTHRSTQDVVVIELPDNWYNDLTFMGLAVCVSFTCSNQHQTSSSSNKKPASDDAYNRFKFYLVARGNFVIYGHQCNFGNENPESDHLLIYYVPFDEYLHNPEWDNSRWDYVEAQIACVGPGIKYKALGIKYVFFQDIENPRHEGIYFDHTVVGMLNNILNNKNNGTRPQGHIPSIEQVNNNCCSKNVAMDLLRNHINSLARYRLQFLCATALKRADEGQCMNGLAIPPLKEIIRSLIDILFKGDCNPPSVTPRLEIYLPGSEVPNWFTYRSNCDSFIIQMPPNWWNNILFMGIAFCVSFTVQDEDPTTSSNWKPASEHVYKLHFNLVFDQGQRRTIIYETQGNFGREILAASDHLFLVYVPFVEYFEKQLPHVEAHFRCEGPGMKYKACGINLVFFSDADNPLQGVFEGIEDITTAVWMLTTMLNSHGRPQCGNPHTQALAIDQVQPQHSSHDYEEAGDKQSRSESNRMQQEELTDKSKAGFDPLGLQSRSVRPNDKLSDWRASCDLILQHCGNCLGKNRFGWVYL